MILYPYHLDERQPDDSFPLAVDRTVTGDPGGGGDVWARIAALQEPLAAAVADRVRADGGATVLSGDCLTAVPVVAGVQRAGVDPAVVWFDAHGDVHTRATSTSGYPGGQSLRLLHGADAAVLAEPLGLRPLAEDRTVLVDARDLDPAEAEFLAGSAVRRSGVAELDAAALPPGPLVLHVDLDVIDGADVPGLLFPVPGGPGVDAVVAACERVLATGRVVARSLALTWRPPATSAESATRSAVLTRLLA